MLTRDRLQVSPVHPWAELLLSRRVYLWTGICFSETSSIDPLSSEYGALACSLAWMVPYEDDNIMSVQFVFELNKVVDLQNTTHF